MSTQIKPALTTSEVVALLESNDFNVINLSVHQPESIGKEMILYFDVDGISNGHGWYLVSYEGHPHKWDRQHLVDGLLPVLTGLREIRGV